MVKLSQHPSVIFRWLGIAGMEFTFGNHTLLIDPFLSRPPLRNVFFGRVSPEPQRIEEIIKTADQLLITHAHYDHLLDVPVIARKTGARVFGSANVCGLLQILQTPSAQLHELHAFDEIDLPYAHVRVIPASHPFIPMYNPGKLKINLKPPLHLRDYRMDECFSFLIEFEKLKFLIWSSISTEHAQPADVLFLRAVARQGWYDEMLNSVHPRLVIPTHWDNMFLPFSKPVRPFFSPPTLKSPLIRRIDLDEFRKKVFRADPTCKTLIPKIFESYDLMSEIG
jgi:L-ascorbate metabolism protein UlaG (beta-lactamase superfamily)